MPTATWCIPFVRITDAPPAPPGRRYGPAEVRKLTSDLIERIQLKEFRP